MNEKKRQIIEAAIHCFAEKGYHATSIQEITDTLGIAKGSIYFYFKNKEDLYVSVFKYYFERMIGKMQALTEDTSLTPRDRLYQQVTHQYQMFMESRDFILTMWKERVDINEDVHKLVHNMNAQILSVYRNCILEMYPVEVEAYSLDSAMLFHGMMSYYLQYMLQEPKAYDTSRLARSLMERLDDIVYGMISKGQPPVVDVAAMDAFFKMGSLKLEKEGPDVFDEIRSIRLIAEQASWAQEVQGEVVSALAVLEEEFAKVEPRSVIVKGMVTLLKSLKLAEIKSPLGRLTAFCE